MRGASCRVFLGLLFLMLLSSPGLTVARVDSTLRARVIYLGDASFSPNKLILQWITAEPKFPLQIVPCDTYFISLAEAKRLTRLYLPRTYQALNGSFDIVIIHDISPTIIPKRVLGFVQRGVEKDGLGLGLISFMFWGGGAGTNDIEVWMTLAFYDIFPADVDTSRDVPSTQGRTYWKVIKKAPILDLPNIEKQPMQVVGNHGGDILARPGSTVHAVWKGRGTPVLVTGRYGSGATLQLAQGWHNPPSTVFHNYRYMADLIYNELYFLADIDPPEDLELAHRAREMFVDTRIRKTVTISTLDFVDKFGAKLDKIETELSALDPLVAEAEQKYLEGDFVRAAGILEAVMNMFPEIEKDLAELKRRTMAWIFLSEWLIIASTSMLCGTSLWWLMIRRRLYRVIETTRLVSVGGEE